MSRDSADDSLTESENASEDTHLRSAAIRFESGDLVLEPEEVLLCRCWRCEKNYDVSLTECEFCHAVNRQHRSASAGSHNVSGAYKAQSPAIVRVVWAFVALGATSILYVALAAMEAEPAGPLTEAQVRTILSHISIVEFIDTIVVLAAMVMIPISPPPLPSGGSRRFLAWVLSVPLLGVVLALNLGYHAWLQRQFGIEDALAGVMAFRNLYPWVLATICFQPAIVEELFFRRLALGAALEATSTTNAVLISSLLFAMAHLGTPLSIPTLTMLGVVLGILRVVSGGLLLPMLFHFAHNLIVISVEFGN